MKKFGNAVVKLRIPILIIGILLLIPSAIGMIKTRINYDMLDYLPDDIETMQGQNILLDDFGKGAFSIVVVDGMSNKDVAALKAEFETVDHVESVIWYDSIMDLSIPMELLPSRLYDAFNSDTGTIMAVFFDTGTSADETMEAIQSLRKIADHKCFISGMSAMVTDLKDLCEREEPIYVAIAVLLCMCRNDDLHGFLDHPLYLPRKYRYRNCMEPWLQYFPGRGLLYYQSIVRRPAVSRHNGLFHLPVAQLYRTA